MVLLSKLLNLLAQPLNLVVALLAVSLYLHSRRPRASRAVTAFALGLLLLSGFKTAADLVLSQLESQSAPLDESVDLQQFAGVVVLGGALDSGRLAAAYRQTSLNAAAERMTETFSLWRRNPSLRVVFTGGEGELFGTGPSESERARLFFHSMGLPEAALVLEDKSQNTYENAVFTARLPGMDKTQRWLLVTSASHMPRSLAVFRKTGWNVTPYPVDFRTAGWTPLTDYSLRDGPAHWELALHEFLGIAAYRLTGRI